MEGIRSLQLFNYKQKIIIHILLDDPSSQKQHIKSMIDKINGVKDSFFTEYSEISDIVVFATWNEEEVKSKLEKLNNISGIKSVTPFILTNNQISAF